MSIHNMPVEVQRERSRLQEMVVVEIIKELALRGITAVHLENRPGVLEIDGCRINSGYFAYESVRIVGSESRIVFIAPGSRRRYWNFKNLEKIVQASVHYIVDEIVQVRKRHDREKLENELEDLLCGSDITGLRVDVLGVHKVRLRLEIETQDFKTYLQALCELQQRLQRTEVENDDARAK